MKRYSRNIKNYFRENTFRTVMWGFGVIGLLLFMLIFSSIFRSISYERGIAGKSEEKDLIVVGFSQLGSESVWRTANTASVQRALSEEEGFYLMTSNARQKQENQIKAIRNFISQQVDYIVFAPITSEGWDTVLKEAKDAGIPVILLDRTINASDSDLYTCSIGTDSRREGEWAAKWLEMHLKRKGMQNQDINIVVLQGTKGASVQIGRTIGFDAIADKHENWHILEQISGEFTTAKGKEAMSYLLRKYDDIDVIVSQNDDMTFGAIEALDEARISYGENGTILISIDAVYNALELVEKGVINADIECNPEQGDLLKEVILRMEAGEEVNKRYDVEEMIFTKENVSQYMDSRTY